MMSKGIPDCESVWKEYLKGLGDNARQGLNDTVQTNEDFFVGNQWKGVEAGGLPTPVFNFLKRVVLFTVAGITSNNLKMQASAMGSSAGGGDLDVIADVVNRDFGALFESNKIVNLLREFLRNAAVDGDACTYTYWDPEIDTGHPVKGAIITEIIENTRVFFGDASDRRVQRQPYIIISRRELLDVLRDRASELGCADLDSITADTDDGRTEPSNMTDDKATVLLRFWRSKTTKTVWAVETTRGAVIRKPWDTGLALYPVTWLCWDNIHDSYHGQAMITGLIPNQIFINKLFAMSMISLMTTAYPKIIYDKTRIAKWDNRVGAAIPVQGGDVNSVAKIIDPAQISPQIAQFINLAVDYTQTFLGATSAALGEARPENTSAIIALQRASATPSELTKQNLYESLEDLGRIYIDFMASCYGTRKVLLEQPDSFAVVAAAGGLRPEDKIPVEFDYGQLKALSLSVKLDIGASAYWSEIASLQTLDNLLTQGKISLIDYLERVPNGYISKQQELIDKLRDDQAAPQNAGEGIAADGMAAPIPIAPGLQTLKHAVLNTGGMKP
ncbi:hypothetical protein SAMN02745823_02539 [Sporobacter termitidis DSM 10068]|uniref:Bacteriophage head to tail connecting protein n=1 Tax=Sporobacter termitidis DSM 10068 TaxID=1123282 RepID=A0A1M5YHD7_9FIRM|nr:hypothetical protein [Sporobacter termitidis]SHI11435.1 hypothetical protein SAMN02745823_02539 [Sporobacter termitidis DSM 10068]